VPLYYAIYGKGEACEVGGKTFWSLILPEVRAALIVTRWNKATAAQG
jgi:hypothetical protein